MALPKKKKTQPRRRPLKTGLQAVPVDHKRGFHAIQHYFHYEIDRKDTGVCIKEYIKKNYSKDDIRAANAAPEYKFSMNSGFGATAYLLLNEPTFEFTGSVSRYPQALKEFCDALVVEGKEQLASKKAETSEKTNVIVLSPQQRLFNKVNETIMVDLDELEDTWIGGEKTDFEMYDQMKRHDLKGAAVPMIVRRLEGWLLDYSDAYHKKCEQAVEGYSHLTRREIKRRMTVIEKMLSELESFKSAQKAQRAPRVKKPKAADKQVAKVKYKKEDAEFKIASIDPTLIVGANTLYVFNTKYRQLIIYKTDAVKGFEVSGTSIKNFYPDLSTKVTIRANKVDETLKVVLSKSQKQIEKHIGASITSKPAVPNGRLNEETVILRAI